MLGRCAKTKYFSSEEYLNELGRIVIVTEKPSTKKTTLSIETHAKGAADAQGECYNSRAEQIALFRDSLIQEERNEGGHNCNNCRLLDKIIIIISVYTLLISCVHLRTLNHDIFPVIRGATSRSLRV